MDINSLKIFCDLIETKSFTKTSFLNYITQSAVSQRLHSIESEFKVPLIERMRGKISTTPYGETFYKTAKGILERYQFLKDGLKEPGREIAGELKVATIYSVGLHELPPYIKRFLKRYPHVRLHIEYKRSNHIYDDVANGVIDLGIVAYPVEKPRIKVIPFRKDRLLLILPLKHRFAKYKTIDIRKLNGYEFVAFEKDIPTRKAIDKIFRDYRVCVNNVLEFDNIETIKRAVEIGIGVSIVPSATVIQELKSRSLRALEFSNKIFSRPLGILYKDKRVLSRPQQKFIEFLTASSY